MVMMLMLVACAAAWTLVALMLGDAGLVLRTALRGETRQAWVPAPALRPASSRARNRA